MTSSTLHGPHPPAAAAAPACLPKLILVCGRASRGDAGAIEQLRVLGEVLALTGGVAALIKLQAALRDHAFTRWGRGARGDLIGTWWDHIPEWTAPMSAATAMDRPGPALNEGPGRSSAGTALPAATPQAGACAREGCASPIAS